MEKVLTRLILLTLIVCGITGCATLRSVQVLEVGDWPDCATNHCTVARVTCTEGNEPIILFRADFNTDRQFLLVHEQVHVSQMKSDCRKVQQSYRDSADVRVRMETEAYCREARARIFFGKSVEEAIERVSFVMEKVYGVKNVTCNLK